jgi:ubiquinone/menaquinone biosynthesis C-methylase UbiE
MRHDGNLVRRDDGAVDAVDPVPVDWAKVTLPDALPDRLDLRIPSHVASYVRRQLGARRRVELPADLPGVSELPGYLRQEFHHLPNGFYSKRLADAYARWFDRFMLGETVRARCAIAAELAECRAVLDAGCGTGGLAAALRAVGVDDVSGLDPSPYLLQIAARRHREVRFVQGVVERSLFQPARFDGVGACFLFHELPARVADAALAELRRVLTPRGVLVIAEPSPVQLRIQTLAPFVQRWGARGLYFALLAKWMHEPFVEGWHQRDVPAWLHAHGFALVSDDIGMPMRFVVARRI